MATEKEPTYEEVKNRLVTALSGLCLADQALVIELALIELNSDLVVADLPPEHFGKEKDGHG